MKTAHKRSQPRKHRRRNRVFGVRRCELDYRRQHSGGRWVEAATSTVRSAWRRRRAKAGKSWRRTTPNQNQTIVLEAFDTLFNQRDYTTAEWFGSPNYIQLSAHIALGVSACSISSKASHQRCGAPPSRTATEPGGFHCFHLSTLQVSAERG